MRFGKHYPAIKPDATDLFDGLFSTRGDAFECSKQTNQQYVFYKY